MVKSFTFSGKVQGIGFRAAAEMLAKRYNINGWVKNNDDGNVILFAEGYEESIKNFIDHLKKYFHDKIEKIEEKEEEEQGFNDFIIQK